MVVVWFFLTVPCVWLQFVIVVFPDHTHYFADEDFLKALTYKEKKGMAAIFSCDLDYMVIIDRLISSAHLICL